jgi:hypothetical protein
LQSVGVFVLCVGLLFIALQATAPRARSSRNISRQIPKCFELEDKDKVRLLGSQNTVVSFQITTGSEGAQTLFSLGMLQAYGFNQHEAANMFQVLGY